MITLTEIEEIDQQMKCLENKRALLLKQWAQEQCPLKINDVVPSCGYSHAGKLCRVNKIYAARDWRGEYRWHVEAVVLKKDSTDSLLKTEFCSHLWDKSQRKGR